MVQGWKRLVWLLLAMASPALAQMPSASQIDGVAIEALPAMVVFQDWQVLCIPSGCQAEPRRSGAPDLSVSILPDGDGQPDDDRPPDGNGRIMVLRAPLGVLLGQGVAVTVDGRSLGRLAFLTCETDGCVAPVRIEGALGRAFRGGSAMTLTLVRRDQSVISADYSLLGFTAAVSELDVALRDFATTP